MDGKCNCGAIKVHVDDSDLYTQRRGHICHCLNCKKTAGSAYATNLRIESSKVTIQGADNLSIYHDPDTLSGNVVERYFCKTCGSPIKSETPVTKKAGTVILKLGIMDRIPQPEHEGFFVTKTDWVQLVGGTQRWETMMGQKPANV